MKEYNDTFEKIIENYGLFKTVTKERFPRKLQLSEEFIESFRKEFKSQTEPIYTEDEDGNKVINRESRDPKRVLQEFQKALKFLI